MARTWLSIRVDLIEGHGEHLWPRPGRISAAARGHTFSDLAEAIDDAFARWDRSHLQAFTLGDGTRLCDPDPDWQIEGEVEEDYRRVRLSRLRPGERFTYVFDFGDNWAHLCTVGARRVDPVQTLGIQPGKPLPYWGWGDIPDQYRRRWDGDDGETPLSPDPGLADLPLAAAVGAGWLAHATQPDLAVASRTGSSSACNRPAERRPEHPNPCAAETSRQLGEWQT